MPGALESPKATRVGARRRDPSLGGRALPHAARLAWAVFGLLAPLATGCDRGAPSAAGEQPAVGAVEPTDADRAELARLLEALTPIDASLTSDHQDAWLANQRAELARACEAGTGVARLALEAFDADPRRPERARAVLLEVAAHGLGAELAPRLEALITTYDDELGLFVRTEAVRILAETSPARALELLAPLAREDRPSSTRPPQAALIEGWILAARSLENPPEHPEVGVLADVATNLFQPPDARYAAIGGLGELGGAHAGAALEEVLTEASSDGYLRRKAAQALVKCVTPEDLCRVLDTLASHESDQSFLSFLADMIDRHCAGIPALESAAAEDQGR